ncbi:MAG TPA: hypothetical protein VJ948_04390 [Acidimicrobiia bacterium]|nr:hypothetical protein [Acidimicrobiia bacterium]
MTEAFLRRLDVDAFDHKSGGIGAAEIVELNPIQLRFGSGWIPDPMQPVRVVEVVAVMRWEDKRLPICASEVELHEMLPEHRDQRLRHGKGAPGCFRLRSSEGGSAPRAACDLLDNPDRVFVEVNPADA